VIRHTKIYTALLAIVSVAMTFAGCASPRYKMVRKDTPPVVPLDVAVAQLPVQLALNAVIIYKGPGSWKRVALWDEYVVTFRNQGEEPLTIDAATLVDFAGANLEPGVDPWVLEKKSQALEKRYRRAGVAFARNALPAVVILGTGTAVAAATVFTATAGVAAVATVVALPVYYIVVLSVNHSNKSAVKAEFARRRLALPITLGPGETHTGSLFFPMVPNPQLLSAQWVSGSAGGDVKMSLEFLQGLHVPSPATRTPAIPPNSDAAPTVPPKL
jgi:hypothetical protein